MSYIKPTVAEFKTYFNRDFPYSNDINIGVTDTDISNAMLKTDANTNEELFCDQASFTIGYQLLTAHFLVMSLRASSQGLGGQYSWLQTSRGAGSVSEGIQVPDRILQNPSLAMLSKTNYGAEYLMMILPLLTGQIFAVYGGTNA